MKSFPQIGMRPIRRAIDAWRHTQPATASLTLAMTYPHYLYLRDQLRPDRTVYFNIDDYSQYWPGRAARINELERQAVLESDLTVCVSRLRCQQLQTAVPEARGHIRHLPHGAPSFSIERFPHHTPAPPPADLARHPGPRLGYIGTLEDRVDWRLLDQVAQTFPRTSVILIGRLGRDGGRHWQQARRQCLRRPNVHLIGWKPQTDLAAYARAFDVNLIPYEVDHPFNEVCNPTKIMDGMGTGRPVVATALPECRLYDHLIEVADTPEAFLHSIESILRSGSDDGRARLRHDHALANSCARVIDRLMDWLDD